MQYTYLLILSLFTTALTAQYIYVSADRDTYGGWIVSPEGETVYTIPDGWRPAAYTGPMGEITIWPLLLKRRDAKNKLHFAFVTKALEWQELAGYLNIDAVGENRFRAMIDYKYFVLLNAKGERISQDSFFDIRPYHQAEFVAVASVGTSSSTAKYGLIDSLQGHPIKKIHLGIRRFDSIRDKIFNLPEDFIKRLSDPTMRQLTEINLDAHRLSPEVLQAVFALPGLRKLSLAYNELTELPTGIKDLRQLEELDLSGTSLTSLPRAIYRMKHLKKLSIINTDLPAETIPALRKALPDTEIVFKY